MKVACSMDTRSAVSLCLALSAVVVLGIAFLFSPEGWNLIPLALIALVLVAAWPTLAAVRRGRGAAPARPLPDVARRAHRALGPVVAGIIIDLVDFATFGQLGCVLGLPLGGLAGYWMGKAMGLGRRGSILCAVAAGIYCMFPGTELIPLATIVGACVRFWESGKRQGRDGR